MPDAIPLAPATRPLPARYRERPLLVFFGHHKCATGWLHGVTREACFHLGWDYRVVNRPEEFAPYGSLAEIVDAEQPHVLGYANAHPAHLHGLPPLRGFHVVRDPRDVIVSGYFSHLHSHPTHAWPELEPHRERLQGVSRDDGLLLEIEFSAQFIEPMAAWDYGHPDVLELRLEDISPRPLEAFRAIFEHLGVLRDAPEGALQGLLERVRMRLNVLNRRGRHRLPLGLPLWPFRTPMDGLPAARLPMIVERKSFERLSGGRRRGEENVRSHYRKGKPGDWKTHFGPRHRDAFKARYGDLLIRLGYESDHDW